MPFPDPSPERPVKALPALVLDTSGSGTFAGILDRSMQWRAIRECDRGALESLFPLAEALFNETRFSPSDIGSFVYCSGPGSVLGIRLCGMAIETWRKLSVPPPQLYHYGSLRLTAELLARGGARKQDILLVSEWKKNAWNAIPILRGTPQPETILSDADLARNRSPVYHLPRRKGWQSPPAGAVPVPYEPKRLPELLGESAILVASDKLIMPESGANTFQKWQPSRHR